LDATKTPFELEGDDGEEEDAAEDNENNEEQGEPEEPTKYEYVITRPDYSFNQEKEQADDNKRQVIIKMLDFDWIFMSKSNFDRFIHILSETSNDGVFATE